MGRFQSVIFQEQSSVQGVDLISLIELPTGSWIVISQLVHNNCELTISECWCQPWLTLHAYLLRPAEVIKLFLLRSMMRQVAQIAKYISACACIQYNTIQYNTIHYNTLQYTTTQYNTIQFTTIHYNTIQYNTIQYKVVSECPEAHGIKIIVFQFACHQTCSRRHGIKVVSFSFPCLLV